MADISPSAQIGSPAGAPLAGVLFLLGAIMPSLVALALTDLEEGRTGVRVLLGGLRKWRVGARWYLFALSYMIAVKLAAAVLNRLALGEWPRFGQTPWYLMAAAIVFSTPVQAGEEIGWRGYALPRLTKHFSLAGRQYRIGSNLGVLAFALLFYSGQRQLRPVLPLIPYGGHCNLRCHGVGLLAHEWELVPDNVTARVYQ